MIPYVPNCIQLSEVQKFEKLVSRYHQDMISDGKGNEQKTYDFTQSMQVSDTEKTPKKSKQHAQNDNRNFLDTVQVVPTSSGQYEILTPNFRPGTPFPFSNQECSSVHIRANQGSYYSQRTGTSLKRQAVSGLLNNAVLKNAHYKHNISNLIRNDSKNTLLTNTSNSSEKRRNENFNVKKVSDKLTSPQTKLNNLQTAQAVKATTGKAASYAKTKAKSIQKKLFPRAKSESDLDAVRDSFTCNCNVFHSHKFTREEVGLGKLYGIDEHPSPVDNNPYDILQLELQEDNYVALTISKVFWHPGMSFTEYSDNKRTVISFASLWPAETELKDLLLESMNDMVLRRAMLEVAKLVCVCGPVRALKCMLDLGFIRINQSLENGASMLHLACLARNADVIDFLVSNGISPNIKDNSGNTADQVCYNSSIKKCLPNKYIHIDPTNKDSIRIVGNLDPSLKDKDTIFQLAANPKDFQALQQMLQTFNFDVNSESDARGDYIIHIACRGGLCQLALLTSLVRINSADINLCNKNGMTPLMVTAQNGDNILCDVLMCLFGTDPNIVNPETGWTALHYAVKENNLDVVNCLIKRGADVNIEDLHGHRPDDISLFHRDGVRDCREIISLHRTQRSEYLGEKIRKNELNDVVVRKTDLCIVDQEDYTLIMVAAMNNSVGSLEILLTMRDIPIDAQHTKTGQTALAMAARQGCVEAAACLLSHKAKAVIQDMEGFLPLHHAVLNNHEEIVDLFLEFFPYTYTGLHKAIRICRRTSIHTKLKSAWERRQEEIVTPELLECAMTGKAEQLYQILEDGDNLNVKSSVGNLPIYLAAENGHLDVLKLLHEKGSDLREHHMTTGSTVLHIAAKMGQIDIIKYLLPFCHHTARHSSNHQRSKALPSWSSSSSSSLLCHKHSQLDINALDCENKPALQIAAEKGYSKIVDLLLAYGASTAILDSNGFLFTCPEYEGVRITIESHREQHSKLIMQCISDHTKRALEKLKRIWMPKFDHNLRNEHGDTPLMAACKMGNVAAVKYLLESAVYTNGIEDEESSYDGDFESDSGVRDSVTECTNSQNNQSEEVVKSLDKSGEHTSSQSRTSFRLPDHNSNNTEPNKNQMKTFLQDISTPKGLYIYHDGIVSHITAVSLYDGSTALHRTIEAGDNNKILALLLEKDRACINMQNDAKYTTLHLACKLSRKNCVKKLLSYEGIDLNVRTLEGQLPEELTSIKAILKFLHKHRKDHPAVETASMTSPSECGDSLVQSAMASTINFDKIHSKYEVLRQKTQGNPNS